MSLTLARPAKQGAYKEERQRRGTEQGRFLGVGTCEGVEGGGGDMVKACSKFGGRRASVRDTRLNKVVDTWTRKKGN